MFLTGKDHPFYGPYHMEESIELYNILNNNNCSLEPLHEFFEMTTRDYVDERLSVSEAIELLSKQIQLIDNRLDKNEQNRYECKEIGRLIDFEYKPDEKEYTDMAAISKLYDLCIERLPFKLSFDYRNNWHQINTIRRDGNSVIIPIRNMTISCVISKCIVSTNYIDFIATVTALGKENFDSYLTIGQEIVLKASSL